MPFGKHGVRARSNQPNPHGTAFGATVMATLERAAELSLQDHGLARNNLELVREATRNGQQA